MLDAATAATFADLGLEPALCTACEALGFTKPTDIQLQSIPPGLASKDVIGIAQTGSGKTAAFALPILHHLLQDQSAFFACVLAPTRELALQIGETFEALGAAIGLKVALLVGGIDSVAQAVQISKRPHVIVATPGRLLDHLENTKGFSLKTLKFLVLDEADRLLDLDFGPEIDKILKAVPKDRTTFLFSATMTGKVEKLQRACLRNPHKIEVSTSKYQTVESLLQSYAFIPAKYKESYLIWILTELQGLTGIIFVSTCNTALRLSLMLQALAMDAVAIHGQMPQASRLSALNRFKGGTARFLIATDVASRGLDIPSVDLVVNYDVPLNPKDYVHRVGRTARAGRSGRAITLVTQYDVEPYQVIEEMIGKKLDEYPIVQASALGLHDRVMEAQRLAILQMKEIHRERDGKGTGSKSGMNVKKSTNKRK